MPEFINDTLKEKLLYTCAHAYGKLFIIDSFHAVTFFFYKFYGKHTNKRIVIPPPPPSLTYLKKLQIKGTISIHLSKRVQVHQNYYSVHIKCVVRKNSHPFL